MCQKQFAKFRAVNFLPGDAPQLGRPVEVVRDQIDTLLENNQHSTLCEVSLANMFSYTVGSVFIFMLFSLAMQKLFILMRSHLFKRYIFHFHQ